MTDRHGAALRAALAERDRIGFPMANDFVVARIVEAALSAADAHDAHDAQQTVLCNDGSRVHDFKGERRCPGCGWGGIFADEADHPKEPDQ